MKMAVLGGSGFIGSHLCDLLSSKGHKVNIFDIGCKVIVIYFFQYWTLYFI